MLLTHEKRFQELRDALHILVNQSSFEDVVAALRDLADDAADRILDGDGEGGGFTRSERVKFSDDFRDAAQALGRCATTLEKFDV